MEFLYLPVTLLASVVSGETPALLYRYGRLRSTPKRRPAFIFSAASKVDGGIRRVNARRVFSAPTRASMAETCVREGEFVTRPYTLGQQRDECSLTCVFALLHDYCTMWGFDASQLLTRAYPGVWTPDYWTEERWKHVRRDADWQGVVIPRLWEPDSITGLCLSLHQHDRRALMDTMLDILPTRLQKPR